MGLTLEAAEKRVNKTGRLKLLKMKKKDWEKMNRCVLMLPHTCVIGVPKEKETESEAKL